MDESNKITDYFSRTYQNLTKKPLNNWLEIRKNNEYPDKYALLVSEKQIGRRPNPVNTQVIEGIGQDGILMYSIQGNEKTIRHVADEIEKFLEQEK